MQSNDKIKAAYLRPVRVVSILLKPTSNLTIQGMYLFDCFNNKNL